MNSLSVNEINLEYYQNLYADKLKNQAERVWMYDHFRVGEEVSTKDIFKSIVYADVLCSKSCELVDYLNKKITDLSDESHKKKHFCDKVKHYSDNHNCKEHEVCDNIINPKW